MKKVMLCVALLGVSSIAFADPAIVIKNDGSCGMPGADVNGNLVFGGIGMATTVVQNDNKVMLKCKGYPILNQSGIEQEFKEFSCGIDVPLGGMVFTQNTHATVSEDGVGTMTCTFKFN